MMQQAGGSLTDADAGLRLEQVGGEDPALHTHVDVEPDATHWPPFSHAGVHTGTSHCAPVVTGEQ